jgi:arylsulfatase
VNYLKESNQLENTVIFVAIGDNGASKEGTTEGTINQSLFSQGTSDEENLKKNLANIDEIGTAKGLNTNFPLGWAQATNVPFKNWKQDAQSEGGTHNPLIVFYPNGIKEKGGIRNQYSHVTDLLPTTLDITGIKAPEYIKNVKQDIIQGSSLYTSLNNANAESLHKIQYYYIFGNRAIYKDGWKAGAAHLPDSSAVKKSLGKTDKPVESNFDADVWELYNLSEDFNERNNLAKKYPEKLTELKKLFDEQAKENNVYPFIDWQDVYNRKIHNSGADKGKTLQDLIKQATKPGSAGSSN